MLDMSHFSDADFRATMWRALRLQLVLTLALGAFVWWKLGWQSAVMLLVGSVVTGSGLWEWMRLMTAMAARMDAGGAARPMTMVLAGFFTRLLLAVAALYVSLRFLDGSVYALAAGLGLGIFALTIEALKLVRAWTV